MSPTEPLIRNISDTARWAAVYRERESERPDALFRDPFARRLAGKRGEQIARTLKFTDRHTWSWVMRTVLFDRFIAGEVQAGADMVINLAAGLDARPYRMDLPSSLRWIEVDLPDLLAYKGEILRDETPRCALERVALDLADVSARRALFERLGGQASRALIVSEGLLLYLTADEVGALARDLAAPPCFRRWVFELMSPGLLRLLKRKIGSHLDEASAPFQFAPPEGPEFFIPHGWNPVEVRSVFRAAVEKKRVPFWMRLLGFLPESNGRQGSRPWTGVCLMAKR